MKTMNFGKMNIKKTILTISTAVAILLVGFSPIAHAQENFDREMLLTIDGMIKECEIFSYTVLTDGKPVWGFKFDGGRIIQDYITVQDLPEGGFRLLETLVIHIKSQRWIQY